MYGVSTHNPDVLCPNCRRVMVDLAGYSDFVGGQGVYEDGSSPRFSPNRFGRFDPEFTVVSFLWDWIANKFKQARIRRLYARLSATKPNSLICPNCTTVVERA